MRLPNSGRPVTAADGVALIEQFILPTLELCKKLQRDGKIVAGGPQSGAVAIILVMNVDSPRELDLLLTSLPLWSRMETLVTPLTTFDDRAQALFARLEVLNTETAAADSAA